jgi:hypothetical protein
MQKTFAAFVAVATIAGSLAATPASAQRGVATGVAAPGRYHVPAPYGAGPGPYDDSVFARRCSRDTAMLVGWMT